MTLADFTSPGLIIPSLRGKDVASVIQELGQALQRKGRIPDLLPFYHAALNREYLLSTEMEAGMAFPHARAPGLNGLAFALGRSAEPLGWGAKAPTCFRNEKSSIPRRTTAAATTPDCRLPAKPITSSENRDRDGDREVERAL